MPRNETMRTIQRLQARDARMEADADLALSARTQRERTSAERAGNEGVWTAALFTAFVAFVIPVWFLGAGVTFAKGVTVASTAGIQIAQIMTLSIGGLALGLGVRSAWVLAKAPRLADGPHASVMPKLALACGILGLVFLHRLWTNGAGLGSDLLASVGAAAPALLMAEISLALPAITRGKHGAGIGGPGGVAWAGAGVAAFFLPSFPAFWWVPTACAVVGALCTGVAAMRVWRRYEGRAVTA